MLVRIVENLNMSLMIKGKQSIKAEENLNFKMNKDKIQYMKA